jgi:hypothetical protein
MKPLFGLITTLALAVMLGVSTVGCDSCEQPTAPPPQRPGQPGQPGQPPGSQGQPGSAGFQKPQISDADLERAAEAYVAIAVINEEFAQSAQQAQNADERQQLQVGANQRMVQAVADAGIDVETFTYIMQQTKQDKNLLNSDFRIAILGHN